MISKLKLFYIMSIENLEINFSTYYHHHVFSQMKKLSTNANDFIFVTSTCIFAFVVNSKHQGGDVKLFLIPRVSGPFSIPESVVDI